MSRGMFRSAAANTSIANPVCDQTLASVTISSGSRCRKSECLQADRVPKVPFAVVEAYHVIPAVIAGIIQAMITIPPRRSAATPLAVLQQHRQRQADHHGARPPTPG